MYVAWFVAKKIEFKINQKMKNVLFILMASLMLSGCSAHRHYAFKKYYPYKRSAGLHLFAKKSKHDKGVRMVNYSASITLEVAEEDTVLRYISFIPEKYEGYLVSLDDSKVVFRVVSEKLVPAVEDACLLGKVISKTLSGSDVTETYEDQRIRLENALNARDRYLVLLEKAENVEAALKVEKELERLNKEIDLLEGKIRNLEHLNEYSTVTVNLEEKRKPGVLSYVGIGLWTGVRWLFVRG